MVLALVLLASGSLTLLLHEHYSTRKAWDRPAWARGALGRNVARAAGWTLLLAGAVLLAGRSPAAGLVTASIVAATIAWTRWVHSATYLARGLRREVERLRRERPGRSEEELLRDVVLARHPRWGEDLAGQIVAEQRDARRVAEMLVRMERSAGGLPGVRKPQ
jgi:hypothetical protein